jgi:hypothetical protein
MNSTDIFITLLFQFFMACVYLEYNINLIRISKNITKNTHFYKFIVYIEIKYIIYSIESGLQQLRFPNQKEVYRE